MCSPRWSTTCVAYSASGQVTFLGPLSTPFPSVRQPGYLLKKRRPVALRPRLTTGLPLSQRAPLPLKEMHPHMYRLTQLWVGVKGCCGKGLRLETLGCCRYLYSPNCLEEVFSETRFPVLRSPRQPKGKNKGRGPIYRGSGF